MQVVCHMLIRSVGLYYIRPLVFFFTDSNHIAIAGEVLGTDYVFCFRGLETAEWRQALVWAGAEI